jgi:RES domain-containing protein
MRAWRICRDAYADLTGEGARLWGGRWNSPGRPLVYAADSAALAVLEMRVHLDLSFDLLPADYVLLTLDLGTASVEIVPSLPPDTAAFGDEWLAAGRTAALQVPSVIVPESANILVNPRHPDATRVTMAKKRPFVFDERLWSGTSPHGPTRATPRLLGRGDRDRAPAAPQIITAVVWPPSAGASRRKASGPARYTFVEN